MGPRPAKVNRVQRTIRKFQDRQRKKQRRRVWLFPVKLALGLLSTAAGVYFIIQIYNAFNTPMLTATALQATVNTEFSAVGYFIRSETVIEAEPEGILLYTATEGKKLSRNALYANIYADASAVTVTQKIAALDARIRTLEEALAFSAPADGDESVSYTTDTSGTETLSKNINALLLDVAEIADRGSYTLKPEAAGQLQSHIINRDFVFGSSEGVQKTVADLKRQRQSLQNSVGEREKGLYTPRAGFFSRSVDGYETVLTPASLRTLDAATLEDLGRGRVSVSAKAVGKTVTDYTWYFATALRPEDAQELKVGQSYNLEFDATGDLQVRVSVYAINRRAGEDSVVIFQSDREMETLISLRRQAVRIVLASHTGLKVPKEALRMNEEGKMGVYVITGLYAEFKLIEPLYETRDYYIVKTDPSSTKSLLLYDEIILSAKDLADRKVIG